MGVVSLAGIKNKGNTAYDLLSVDDPNGGTKKDYGLYRTDTETQDAFPKNVAAPNPVYEQLAGQPDPWPDWSVHPNPYINRYKTCELAFRAGLPGEWISPTDGAWGNWRKAFSVSDRVLLWIDSPVMSFSYSHNLTEAYNDMKPGFMNTLEGAAEAARLAGGENTVPTGGKFVSRYTKVPKWDGSNPVSLSTALKFEFEFGQAGIFSGEHEVVRPIMALAIQLVPRFADGNYLVGPAPTKPTYFAAMVTELAGSLGTIGNRIKEIGAGALGAVTGGGTGALVTGITGLQNDIYNAIDRGIESGASGKGGGGALQVVYVRMGRLVCGPYAVKDISWEFDFNETDEYGFPFKGSLTLGNLQSIYVPTAQSIVNMFDVGAA